MNQVWLLKGCPANRAAEARHAPFVQATFVEVVTTNSGPDLLILLVLSQTNWTYLFLDFLEVCFFRRHVFIKETNVESFFIQTSISPASSAAFINAIKKPCQTDHSNSTYQHHDDFEDDIEAKDRNLLH